MSHPTIIGDGHERDATDEELAQALAGLTALDGTSYADIWRDSQDEDGDQ